MTEKVLKVLFTGYIPAPKEKAPLFYIGMMNTTISGNALEGVRVRAGGMTTAWLNPHLFGRGYVAYGFRDERVKGLAELEYSFHKKKSMPMSFDSLFETPLSVRCQPVWATLSLYQSG